jgi:hypothetical protein
MDDNERSVVLFTGISHAIVHTFELSVPILVAIWLLEFSVTAALLGTAVAVPTYYIGKRASGRFGGVVAVGVLALTGSELASRSAVGFADHHVAEALFQVLAVLTTMVAISVANREKPVYELFVARDVASLRRPVGGGRGSAVCTGNAEGIHIDPVPELGLVAAGRVPGRVHGHLRTSIRRRGGDPAKRPGDGSGVTRLHARLRVARVPDARRSPELLARALHDLDPSAHGLEAPGLLAAPRAGGAPRGELEPRPAELVAAHPHLEPVATVGLEAVRDSRDLHAAAGRVHRPVEVAPVARWLPEAAGVPRRRAVQVGRLRGGGHRPRGRQRRRGDRQGPDGRGPEARGPQGTRARPIVFVSAPNQISPSGA